MANAFEISLRKRQASEYEAELDYLGNIVEIGPGLRDVFQQVFGAAERYPLVVGKDGPYSRFLLAYQRFVHSQNKAGFDDVSFPFLDRTFRFQFEFLHKNGLAVFKKGIPFVKVLLVIDADPIEASGYVDFPTTCAMYDLSKREAQVVESIFKGLSNKAIAQELGVEESTIKRHSHNIFEKTGFRSRTELVLGLPRRSRKK